MLSKSDKKDVTIVVSALIMLIIPMLASLVQAAPSGPTATVSGNTTKNAASTTKINSTINNSISPGGFIFTMNLDSVQQDTRWKGYVGNVTGTLTLDDAADNTLFSWSLSSVTGEVYATRASGNVNWSGINCTWIADGRVNKSDDTFNISKSNRTPEHNENIALSHTNKDDNITATFDLRNHSSITVGSVVIGKDQCFSVQTYQRDAAQVFSDSDNANFTQVILYDAAYNITNGNVVYETKIEGDITGYRSGDTYDFQIILPESGAVGFTASTAYYFYVELT